MTAQQSSPVDLSIQQFFNESALFSGVDNKVITMLRQKAIVHKLAARDVLFNEGEAADSAWCLVQGTIKLSQSTANGGQVSVVLIGSPAMFGRLEALIHHPVHNTTAKALVDCLVLKIHKDFLHAAINESHAFAKNQLHAVASMFHKASQIQRTLGLSSVEQRLADMLCSYAQVLGKNQEGGKLISIPLSYEELAADIGSVQRSVARALAAWTKAGMLQRRASLLWVDVKSLRAQGSEEQLSLYYPGV